MTILGTAAILSAIADGAIVCDPAPVRVEGAHIDVTLGAYRWLQRRDGSFERSDSIEDEPHVFRRGRLYLCHTVEYIGTTADSGLVPIMYGRSTAARNGVAIHLVAGLGDPGFVSRWTLEIVTTATIAIPVGARVGCVAFHRVEGAAAAYAPGTRYNVTPAAWTPDAMLPRKGNW